MGWSSITFHVSEASAARGRYDLITILEALHDMSRPVEVLRALRGVLADGGALVVGDENMSDTFAAPGNDVERIMYGASITVCLPNGLAHPAVGRDRCGDPSRDGAPIRDGRRVHRDRGSPDGGGPAALLQAPLTR